MTQIPKYPSNGMFIGVVEDEKSHMTGRHIMEVHVNRNEFMQASTSVLRGIPAVDQTEIFQKLVRERRELGNGILLDLIFTDDSMYRTFSDKCEIKMIKAINLDKTRSERTIVEVVVEGIAQPMVLKCIECKIKPTVMKEKGSGIETIMQQEVSAFDSLPEEIKHIFVKKYAHGRLWIDKTSYEVILMERLFVSDLNYAMTQRRFEHDIPVQYEWLSQAFGLLHTIHKAGYSHGDANCQNILWTDGIGEGTMKFIDIERMINLNSKELDNAVKAVCKLSDIGQLLLQNSLAEMGKRRQIFIDYGLLHERLRHIKKELFKSTNINSSSGVFLDDVLPFDDSFKDCRIDFPRLIKFVNSLIESHPSQYEKMTDLKFNENLDVFTSNLSNPLYLKKVFTYILMQINKSADQSDSIDLHDMDIPNYQTLLVTPLPELNSAQQRIKSHNVFPLKFGKDYISIYWHDKLWEVYYEIVENDDVSLIAFDGNEVRAYDGTKPSMIYSNGSQLLSKSSSLQLYFSFNETTAVLRIYEPNPKKMGDFVLLKQIYFHEYHK